MAACVVSDARDIVCSAVLQIYILDSFLSEVLGSDSIFTNENPYNKTPFDSMCKQMDGIALRGAFR